MPTGISLTKHQALSAMVHNYEDELIVLENVEDTNVFKQPARNHKNKRKNRSSRKKQDGKLFEKEIKAEITTLIRRSHNIAEKEATVGSLHFAGQRHKVSFNASAARNKLLKDKAKLMKKILKLSEPYKSRGIKLMKSVS
jgi:hypothetical protein